MSFEERSDSGRAPGELAEEALDFPPALAALAEQLSDEADSLASCFPARNAVTITAFAAAAATTTRQWRSTRRLAVVSGICAAAVLVVLLGWQAVLRVSRDGAVVERGEIPVERSNQVAQLNDLGDNRRQFTEMTGGEENVLKGLSGAEQEAVLDLMENGVAHQASLSI